MCLSVWSHLILAVCYENDIAWSLTNKNLNWFGTFFLQWIIFLYCINQKLRMDENFFNDYFLRFCWVIIIRQWCSSNHNRSAHDFVSKLPQTFWSNRHNVGPNERSVICYYWTTRHITHNVLGVKYDRERPHKCKFKSLRNRVGGAIRQIGSLSHYLIIADQ